MFNRDISFAANLCAEAGDTGYANANFTYEAEIDLYLRISLILKAKGFDPLKFPRVIPDGTVKFLDIADLIKKLAVQEKNTFNKIKTLVDECDRGSKTPQMIIKEAGLIAAGGLSAVLPEKSMRIDATQVFVDSGYWSNALAPKLREQALSQLGISGDVACIIRNPTKIFESCSE